METLAANLSSKSRRVTKDGRTYIVAPVSMIVPGVLAGSKGSLYYPPDEVAKDPAGWNQIPITIAHPSLDGLPVSARTPSVLDRQGVGYIEGAHITRPSARYPAGRLAGQGWFDVERTRAVDPRVLSALEGGRKIEVSTGLYTETAPATPGSIDEQGRPYDSVARNYRPDHLAVLFDERGACSLLDGCGIHNQTPPAKDTEMSAKTETRSEAIDYLVANCDCWAAEGDKDLLAKLPDEKLQQLKTNTEARIQTANAQKAKEAEGRAKTATAPTVTFTATQIPAPPSAKLTTNEWLATAPAEVQSVVRHALAMEQREKEALVSQLTANVSVESKPHLQTLLLGKSTEELRTLQALVPATTSYFGGAAPAINHQEPRAGLAIPAFDYSEFNHQVK